MQNNEYNNVPFEIIALTGAKKEDIEVAGSITEQFCVANSVVL